MELYQYLRIAQYIINYLIDIGVPYDEALKFADSKKVAIRNLETFIYYPRDVCVNTKAIQEVLNNEESIGCTRSMDEEPAQQVHQR